MNMIQELLNKTRGKQVILLGELHGTKEIPVMLENAFSRLAKKETFNVALEIPSRYQSNIDRFLLTGKDDYLFAADFFLNTAASDGRNSLEYLNLIRKIYAINKKQKKSIHIFCIELDHVQQASSAQEEKETELTKRIIALSKKGRLFVVLGDIHAAKKIIAISNQQIIPAGYRLAKAMGNAVISIRFSPRKGSFFNGKMRVVAFDQENSKFDAFFDVIIPLSNVTPCSFARKGMRN